MQRNFAVSYLHSYVAMIDRVKLRIFCIDPDFLINTFAVKMSHYATDFEFDYFNFKGYYKAYNNSIILDGSLHKFFKRNNYTDFSYEEVCLALTKISRDFNKELKDITLTFVEIGVNLELKYEPNAYYYCFVSYNRNHYGKMFPKKGTRSEGVKCVACDMDSKVYDKGYESKLELSKLDKMKVPKNLIRIEVALKANFLRRNKLVFTAEEICLNKRIFIRYLRELKNACYHSFRLNKISDEDLAKLNNPMVTHYLLSISSENERHMQFLKKTRRLKNWLVKSRKLMDALKHLSIEYNYLEELDYELKEKVKLLLG